MKALIALDGSLHAPRTLEAVGGWASTWNVDVHLLTVLKPGEARDTVAPHDFTHSLTPVATPSGVIIGVDEPPLTFAENRTQAFSRIETETSERLLDLMRKYLPLATGLPVVRVADNVAETILKVAAEFGVDLIVVGTHGRSGLSHVLLGSVAETVIREASMPVLVVGPKVGVVPV
ncbi:MAG: universal stress protein [Tepidiformaceae bacterium]